MEKGVIMEIADKIMEEISFGLYKNTEEGKPLLWGIIVPMIFSLVWWGAVPLVVVPGVAALIMLTKGEEKKAADTIGYSLIFPFVGLLLMFLSLVFTVF